jgi:hypothetical protein
VDSELLRFISEQKKEKQQQLIEPLQRDEQEDITQNPDMPYSVSDTVAERALEQQQSSAINEDDLLVPWIGQYNRNRVSKKLLSIGADNETAQLAGEKVQSLVLVRTARRRVRQFLRERDALWNSQNLAMPSAQQLIQNKILSQEPPHPEYGFDDVVELLMECGLTGIDIGTILAHSPSVALMMPRRSFAVGVAVNGETNDLSAGGETLEETMHRSLDGLLMSTLQLRKYDARKVLRSCPGLLSMRGSKSAVQVISMMTKIGVSTSSIARDKMALPALLSRPPSGLFRLIAFLSSDAVRMPTKSIGPLIRRKESRALLDKVAPVPRVQSLQEDPVVSETSTESEEATDPNVASALWGRSSEKRRDQVNQVFKNMTETAWTLRNEIGTEDLGKVVAAFPSVLLLDASEQILPAAEYLMEDLGILEGDLPRVLQLYPVLLAKDLSEMKQIVSFLVALGVEEDDLPSIFRSFPALLTMDLQKDMVPVVKFLLSIGISNVARFITRLPPILGYSVEKELQPKWAYLNKKCVYANFELSRFPAYFSYPFERVIKNRYEYLTAKGLPTHLIPVDTVLRFGDKDFATKVAKDEDGGNSFLQFAEDRKETQGPPKKPKRPKAMKSAK